MQRGRRGVTQGSKTDKSQTLGLATRAAWASAMADALASRLSPSPQRDEIIRVMSKALAPTTAGSYGGHLSRFVAFCAAQPDRPSPLPAATDTVLRWLAGDVCAQGRVKADSLQPYLSAINRIHSDMGFDAPAVGHLVESYKSGLAHVQTAQGRPSERVYLPPPVVEQVLYLKFGDKKKNCRLYNPPSGPAGPPLLLLTHYPLLTSPKLLPPDS